MVEPKDGESGSIEERQANQSSGIANGSETAAGNGERPVRVANPVETPPDGGYGWICTACVFLVNAHTWGVNSSYGVFLSHYLANNSFAGATHLDYALVGGLSISCALLLSPLATYTTRIFGTRTTLFMGVFFETLALVGASFATQTWHLFLTQGVCFGWGMGFLFVATAGIIPQWFTKKRSFANGIGTAGSGIGGMIYSLATGAMIQNIGLPWTFRVLGILSFVVNTVCAFLVKDRNKIIGASQLSFDHRLLKKPEFLLMLTWGFFSLMGYVVLIFTLPDYASSVGLSPQQGSVIAAILNLGQGLGRPLIGIFSDSGGRINVATLLSFLCGLFCLVIWVFAKSDGVLIFFSTVGGTVAGTIWCTIAPVGAEVLGLQDLPAGLSIAWLVFVVPSLVAEPIALELRQSNGDIYLHAQLFTGVMFIAAAISLWFVRSWKIKQHQTKKLEMEEFNKDPGPRQGGGEVKKGHEPHVQPFNGSLQRLFVWIKV